MKRKHKIEVGVKQCNTCEQNIRCNECVYKGLSEELLKEVARLKEENKKRTLSIGDIITYNNKNLFIEYMTFYPNGDIHFEASSFDVKENKKNINVCETCLHNEDDSGYCLDCYHNARWAKR